MNIPPFYMTLPVFRKAEGKVRFQKDEEKLLPILPKYRDPLLYRLGTEIRNAIYASNETSYETHLLSFPFPDGFESYRHDPERKVYTHVFQQSVRSVLLTEGQVSV